MIKSNDDIRYCQDVFGCFPVADIVKTRTAKFLKKYKEANDNNIVCQACSRYWLSSCRWLVKFLCLFIFVFLFILFIVYHLWWNKDVYINSTNENFHRYSFLKLCLFQRWLDPHESRGAGPPPPSSEPGYQPSTSCSNARRVFSRPISAIIRNRMCQ